MRREEVESALAARHELGTEYDQEIVDAFLEKVEKRLDERLSAAGPPAKRDRNQEFVITLASLGTGIPMLAIAGDIAGSAGIFAVCAALVLVNYVVRRV